MLDTDEVVRVYEDLAFQLDRQGQARLRDCYLVLAADAAHAAGRDGEADRIRVQLLSFNPNHLLRPYSSFAVALRSPDIQSYVEDLRLSHPPEAAQRELQQAQRTKPSTLAPGLFPSTPKKTTSPALDVDEPRTFPMKPPATPAPSAPPPPVRVNPTVTRAPQPGKAVGATPKSTVRQRTPVGKPFAAPPSRSTAADVADEEPAAASRLLVDILFVVTLAGGALLAVWTALGPFIPAGWGQQ